MTCSCHYITDYIELVRSGTVAVCKEQLQLCELVEKEFKKGIIYVDENQLERYFNFQKYFSYKLVTWEKFCFALHNCTYSAPGILRWPDLFIMVARGAGKNGYLAFEDFCLITPVNGVKEYHIDMFAMSETQAATTFNDIYNMLEANKDYFEQFFYWNKEVIKNLKTKSEIKYHTSGPKTKDGLRSGKVDFDEYHAYQNTTLIDLAEGGLGKKKYPRETIITTQGDIRDGPLDEKLGDAQLILEGEIEDNGMLPFICKLDEVSEKDDSKNWVKANPTFAHMDLDYSQNLFNLVMKQYNAFKKHPVTHGAWQTKRMNIPFGQREDSVVDYKYIKATNKPVPDLTGKTCVWALDYATTSDFVAMVLLFFENGKYYVIHHTWICKYSKDLDRIKYPWKNDVENGDATLVDSVQISPQLCANWLATQMTKYNVVYGAIDKYRWTLVSSYFESLGFTPEKKEKGVVTGNIKLVRPSDIMAVAPQVIADFQDKLIVYGDIKIMRWYTNNAKKVMNKDRNIEFKKIEGKSRKTDGFMAYVASRTIGEKLTQSIDDFEDDIYDCYSY